MMKRLLMASILILIAALACSAQTSSQDKDRITEVTLERTSCLGTCPDYKVTLRRDGAIIYEGRRFVQMMGTYKGETYGYDRLVKLIVAQKYYDIKDDYSRHITDMPSSITSVERAGKSNTIGDYAETE